MRCVYRLGSFGPYVALASAVAILAAAQVPTHVLRLSDQVGQTNRYRLTFDIRMRAEVVGEGEPDARTRQLMETLASGMGMRTALEYEQVLTAVEDDGTRAFEVRWRDYEFSGEIGGRPIPPPPLHVQSTRDLLSQTARVRTTPSGRTVEVSYTHPDLAVLARQFEQLEGAMPTYLPETPVKVGDRWTSVGRFPVGLSAEAGADMALRLDHTLEAIREGSGGGEESETGPVAVIGLSGTFSNLRGVGAASFDTPLHMEASLTGSTSFDIGRGRYVSGHYEIDMFALQTAGGIEIQLTGHATGNLELLSGR